MLRKSSAKIAMTIDEGVLGWLGQILAFLVDLFRRPYNIQLTA